MFIRWDDIRIDKVFADKYKTEFDRQLKSIGGWQDIWKLRRKMEADFARSIGLKYATLVNSGTDAFDLILSILGIGEGDSVIIPNITYPTIPLAILQRGAKPIIIEVTEDSLNIDETKIEERIQKNTKAIVAAHMFGRLCNIEKVVNIGEKNGILVIEDSCQAFGSTYKGKMAGSWGDCSFFSFNQKLISSCGGGGGLVCFGNREYEKKVSYLTTGYFEDKPSMHKNKRISYIHFLDLIDIMQKFKQRNVIIKAKLKAKKKYEDGLSGIKGICIFKDHPESISVPDSNFLIFVDKREQLVGFLKKHNISVTPVNFPCPALHVMDIFKEYTRGEYLVSDIYKRKALYLPCFSFILDKEIEYIIGKMREFYSG